MHASEMTHIPPLNDLVVMVTYRCNLNCTMCWGEHHINPRLFYPELTGLEIEHLLTRSKMFAQVNQLTLTGGEVFLNQHIFDICQSLVEHGRNFRFFTNGSFPKRLEKLLSMDGITDYLSLVNFSIDGPEAIHDKFRRHGNFKNVLHCLDICGKHNIPVHVNTVIMNENIDYLEETQSILKDYRDNHGFNPHYGDLGYDLLPENLSRIKPFLAPELYDLVASNIIQKKVNTSCKAGTNRCIINPNLTVIACNTSMHFSDGFLMGDLRELNYDFDLLWDSEQAQKARDKVVHCRGCASFCEK